MDSHDLQWAVRGCLRSRCHPNTLHACVTHATSNTEEALQDVPPDEDIEDLKVCVFVCDAHMDA